MNVSFMESLGWLLTYGVIWFAVAAVIFLVIRQAVLWYFRINQMADNLQFIADHYRAIRHDMEMERIKAGHRNGGATTPAQRVYSAPAPMSNRRLISHPSDE